MKIIQMTYWASSALWAANGIFRLRPNIFKRWGVLSCFNLSSCIWIARGMKTDIKAIFFPIQECQDVWYSDIFQLPALFEKYLEQDITIRNQTSSNSQNCLDFALVSTSPKYVTSMFANLSLKSGRIDTYDSFSDVGESWVCFASKTLTPCRMHWNAFLIAQIIAKCHSFPNM